MAQSLNKFQSCRNMYECCGGSYNSHSRLLPGIVYNELMAVTWSLQCACSTEENYLLMNLLTYPTGAMYQAVQ